VCVCVCVYRKVDQILDDREITGGETDHTSLKNCTIKGAFTYTRGKAIPRGGRECKKVQESRNLSSKEARDKARRCHARGIAYQIVQYNHSGTIHT